MTPGRGEALVLHPPESSTGTSHLPLLTFKVVDTSLELHALQQLPPALHTPTAGLDGTIATPSLLWPTTPAPGTGLPAATTVLSPTMYTASPNHFASYRATVNLTPVQFGKHLVQLPLINNLLFTSLYISRANTKHLCTRLALRATNGLSS